MSQEKLIYYLFTAIPHLPSLPKNLHLKPLTVNQGGYMF